MKNKYLKLDPLHPYYRVCLWPQCDNPQFMANRSDQDYCCKAHYDADFNRYRRIRNPKTKAIYDDKINSESESSTTSPPSDTPPPVSSSILQEQLNKNIEIFSRLLIDKRDGTIYSISYLEDQGVDLRHYSYVYPLYNMKNGQCIMYGNYHTFLMTPLEILIYYKP